VISEDKVAMRGTHTGNLFGTPASGCALEVSQFQIECFEHGRIIEHWRQSDDLGMMTQIGAILSD